ncbi:MAG: tRNA (adenosine(37)-N6)-threonylcarbamoyltransferase complex transferase subunit TsaD [Thermoleophilia bacterium]|nr:tRNA (adenosine(37)-N6)-threonylcarbamoyltransferase complex transferase subunit TsaD [Thermoleophilia bacterium]
MILAIETSCDDTCAAIMDGDRLSASIVSSQTEFHALYGGVVPEVASRHHLELVNPVIAEALEAAKVSLSEISRIAVTNRPGLIGALLVGVSTAKAIAYSLGVEFVAVSHLEGHIAANYLSPEPMEPPFVCLVASGGHTSIVMVHDYRRFDLLGQTLDDAAGEALDKGARLLGLGYPGGAEMDALAACGDPEYITFPVGLNKQGNLDFSFSGVKTALYYKLKKLGGEEIETHMADIAASYQASVVKALVGKTIAAAMANDCAQICLSGGVSANSELRRRLFEACDSQDIRLRIPPPELCTDNAAMIASAARYLSAIPFPEYLSIGAMASGGFAA